MKTIKSHGWVKANLLICVLLVMATGLNTASAQGTDAISSGAQQQKIIALSKNKWQWMSDKNVDSLAVLLMKNPSSYIWVDPGANSRKSISLAPAAFITRKPISIRYL